MLIPAGSSSVGLKALEIINYAGATPITLACTSEKKQHLLDAVAAQAIAAKEYDLVR